MEDMELRDLCNLLADLERERIYQHKKRQTANMQMQAFVRNNLGFQTTAPKKERDRICDLAREIIDAVRDGEPVPDATGWSEAKEKDICELIQFTERMRAGFAQAKEKIEKRMEKVVKDLPVWPWAESVKGLGSLSLAKIVGEAGGDREKHPGIGIGQFRNPSCLWKWFCLHVDGGDPGQDAAHYRKSIMWNVSNALIKAGGEYYQLYLERKETEFGKAIDEGLAVVASSTKRIESWVEKGLPRPSLRSELDFDVNTVPSKGRVNARSVGHIARRAERYIEKRLLRELWKEWP